MTSLKKEEPIMASNDGSITLTTHRVMQRTDKINKEIMLTEFLSYEKINRKINYFKILSIIFFFTTILSGIWAYTKDQENNTIRARITDTFQQYNSQSISNREQQQAIGGVFMFSLILFGISLLLYLLSSQKYIHIAGKFSSIDFSIKNLSTESLNKFLTALTVESDNRKRE